MEKEEQKRKPTLRERDEKAWEAQKKLRAQGRKAERGVAKQFGHKLGHNNRRCKRCGTSPNRQPAALIKTCPGK